MTSTTKAGSTRTGRRGARRLRAVVLAVLTTIGFAATGAASAQAARTDVCPSWGCASATFSWAGSNYLAPLSMSYADTKCDGITVKFALRMQYSDGSIHLTSLRTAGGCHDGYKVTNTSWTGSGTINWVQGVLFYDYLGKHPAVICGTRVYRNGTKTGTGNQAC